MNAQDVLREKKKKQQVRIVSEQELEKLEATPLTTESLFQEFQPVVSVLLEFPDGSERLVKVRRFNNAEAFTGIGVYTFIQDDGTIDENAMTEDEKIELMVKIKRHTVVTGMEDPMFKLAAADGEGYPVESLGSAYLNLFYDAVNAVNNPKEVQDFLRNFRETNENRTGTTANTDVGQESSTVSPETQSTDPAPAPDTTLSPTGIRPG